jgi:hypothetical protein
MIAGLSLAVLIGCGKEQFPKEPVGNITTFSLGSAHFTPFKKRPTAKELYDTTLRLYDSFHSFAVSHAMTSRGVFDPYGKGVGTRVTTASDEVDCRWAGPETYLQITWIKGRRNVAVCNGEKSLFYRSWNNTYRKARSLPMPAWNELGLLRHSNVGLKLLPDSRVAGTEVYVLQMIAEQRVQKIGGVFRTTRTLYLGKSDLLPRKYEDVFDKPPATNGRKMPPSTSTTVFHGMNANVDLPDALFPSEPPKGAKPY